MSSGSGTGKSHESAILQEYLEKHRQKAKLQSELLDVAKSTRVINDVFYEMHIDTFNLFRHAHDGLEPFFAAVPIYSVDRAPVVSRPSAAEYAQFAKVFLSHVSGLFEAHVMAGFPDGISERVLKSEIWKVVDDAKSVHEIPDADTIVCFHQAVNLFGAKFDKSELTRCIDRQISWSRRQGDLTAVKCWIELRRRVAEEDAVDLTAADSDGSRERRKTTSSTTNFSMPSLSMAQVTGFQASTSSFSIRVGFSHTAKKASTRV